MNTAPLHFAVRSLGLRAGGLARGRSLFESLSFEVRAHERWVVLGPNGAGKSSLLAALAGVFSCASGELRLQEKLLSDWRAETLADWRAWCPQFWADPFAASVLDTICLARDRGAWWGRVNEIETDAELERIIVQLELSALVDADVRSLSGGERQRVAVATALLQGAPLLLLDEPASHQDLAHQQLLIAVLRAHADAGGAVITSLHDLNLAWDLASHAVLIDGRGAAIAGTRDEVMTPQRLADVFGVAVEQVEVHGQRRFWIGAQASEQWREAT